MDLTCTLATSVSDECEAPISSPLGFGRDVVWKEGHV